MSDEIHLEKVSEVEWEIPMSGRMVVPARIFASERLLKDMKEDRCLEQSRNMATLRGAVKYVIALSDAHQGYGFPIGGVAAFGQDGVVSPGGVGYDINCGVRMLSTGIAVKDFMAKRSEVLREIFRTIPSGVGKGGREYSRDEIRHVMERGSEWAVERGLGTREDLDRTEEGGRMREADPRDVSERALDRGLPQLGTLGSGNHFLEVQSVDRILNPAVCARFGLDQRYVNLMIHCGSRGLGHQVASDYIKLMEREFGTADLPDRELVNAPIGSDEANRYISAMNCAVNFAFCNRQMIMHQVRQVLGKFFPGARVSLVYDVCHNVAKFENHEVDGRKMRLCVHRKGATRSFGPGRPEVPACYRDIGQPVIIPGSMGTASYVLAGTVKAGEMTFGSTAHGAGRVESRTQARRQITAEDVMRDLKRAGVEVSAFSKKGLVEEAPGVYKDIDEVVRVSHEAGIGSLVARLKPLAVMKG